jgi:hypothetical protein
VRVGKYQDWKKYAPAAPRVAHFFLDALLAGNSLLIAVNRCYSLFFYLFFPVI